MASNRFTSTTVSRIDNHLRGYVNTYETSVQRQLSVTYTPEELVKILREVQISAVQKFTGSVRREFLVDYVRDVSHVVVQIGSRVRISFRMIRGQTIPDMLGLAGYAGSTYYDPDASTVWELQNVPIVVPTSILHPVLMDWVAQYIKARHQCSVSQAWVGRIVGSCRTPGQFRRVWPEGIPLLPDESRNVIAKQTRASSFRSWIPLPKDDEIRKIATSIVAQGKMLDKLGGSPGWVSCNIYIKP